MSKAKLQAELEAIEERRKAIETEMAMVENDQGEKIVRREFFEKMRVTERMSFIKDGGRVID